MRNPDSNILAATLSVPVVVLSQFPNSIVALSFFYSAMAGAFFVYQSFLVKSKNIIPDAIHYS